MKDIFWIGGEGAPPLAIVMRPRGEDWLEDELLRIRRGGVDTIVSMLESFEAEMLGLGRERAVACETSLEFLSFPIADTSVPRDVARFRRFVSDIAQRLSRGERVGVHCRGGIGRATIVAACALIHMGWEPRRALEAIARARGVNVPDTPEQEAWILQYKAEA